MRANLTRSTSNHTSSWKSALMAAIFAATCLTPAVVDARRKKKRRKKAPIAKINAKELGELMGPYKFGMSKADILKILAKELQEEYDSQIRETTDVYKQDALRRKRKREYKKIAASYREFRGKKTGWDVSIIDDQFGHRTGESMLVRWENNESGQDQRRFFFFHDGNLYKMFIALDAGVIPAEQRNFATFKSLMVRRYGKGAELTKTKYNGDTYPIGMDWKTRNYHVQALDKLSFYGAFCLMIADPEVEDAVASARDANRVEKKSNSVIDSMLENGDSQNLDSNKAAVESLLRE